MTTPHPSPWPRRLALATLGAAVPLLLFGGSVTTMGAGMAVHGWWNAEGHFLPFFPIEKWFRDAGTFVEHSHRQLGMLTGLSATALVVVTWLRDGRRSARVLSLVALAAICGQGALGGFRVLENSPRLAFLHGAFAQAVFALLAATALFLSAGWRGASPVSSGGRMARPDAPSGAGALRPLAFATVAVVYAQVVLGAWYRHGLRPTPAPGSDNRLALHMLAAFAVLGLILALGGALRARAAALEATSHDAEAAVLRRTALRLQVLLAVQIGLGGLAWVAYRPDAVGAGEGVLSVLHVLCGALLLAQTVAAAMWSARLTPARSRGGVSAAPAPAGLGGGR